MIPVGLASFMKSYLMAFELMHVEPAYRQKTCLQPIQNGDEPQEMLTDVRVQVSLSGERFDIV